MVTEEEVTRSLELESFQEVILSPGAKLQAGRSDHGLHRPARPIDLVELEKLCMMQCTLPEIGAWFNLTADQIMDRQRKNPEMYEVMERGRARGRISIRRRQIQLLEAGGPAAGTMAVWLGKNVLGQRDYSDVAVHSPGSPDLEVNVSARQEISSRIARIAQRAGTGSGS